MSLNVRLQINSRMIAEINITRLSPLVDGHTLCHYRWSADWRTEDNEFFMAKGTVDHPYDHGAMSLVDAVLRQILLTPQYIKSLEGVKRFGDELSRLESEAAGRDGKFTDSSPPPSKV